MQELLVQIVAALILGHRNGNVICLEQWDESHRCFETFVSVYQTEQHHNPKTVIIPFTNARR